jgi:hypothetical protein
MGELELEPGEEVIRAVRKHWFVLGLTLLPLLLLAWVPTLILPALALVSNQVPGVAQLPIASLANSPYVRLVYGLYLLMLWSAAFNTITRYYLNEWIITTKRIVEIHQFGFFSREVSDLFLTKIQDVDVNIDGIFGTLLSYGQLEVQSAGSTEHFIMDDIPYPNQLRDDIMDAVGGHTSDTAPV